MACRVVQHMNKCAQICGNNSPDKYDSTGNGTVMLRFRVAFRLGKVPVMLVQSNSQGPFRFSQALRCICGRGYSLVCLSFSLFFPFYSLSCLLFMYLFHNPESLCHLLYCIVLLTCSTGFQQWSEYVPRRAVRICKQILNPETPSASAPASHRLCSTPICRRTEHELMSPLVAQSGVFSCCVY